MRRGVLVLSGLLVMLAAAALVHWAAGFPAILPWPVLLVVLAIGGGGFVLGMLRDQAREPDEIQTPSSPRRIYKKHRPRGRAKKRVMRNAIKRRRFRKAGAIILSHESEIANPGGHQVGFFG
jgi:hypothetical protein